MRKITNGDLFAHVQRFVREVYADRLRQAGFSSYMGEDIHWFRLVNNEVVHTIYFVTNRIGFPVMLEICYGYHPLFIPPVLQRGPYINPMPGYEQMDHRIPEIIHGSMPSAVQRSFISGISNKIYRIPDVLVHCPEDEQSSQLILEKVLSVLEPIDTPAACYEAHKLRRAPEIENDSWLMMTPHFVDEVLYWEDSALYAYCMRYVEGKLEWLEAVMQEGKLTRKVDRQELSQLSELRDVFRDEGRTKYMLELHDRMAKNLKLLKTKTSAS